MLQISQFAVCIILYQNSKSNFKNVNGFSRGEFGSINAADCSCSLMDFILNGPRNYFEHFLQESESALSSNYSDFLKVYPKAITSILTSSYLYTDFPNRYVKHNVNVIGQYLRLLNLGQVWYDIIMSNCTKNSEHQNN